MLKSRLHKCFGRICSWLPNPAGRTPIKKCKLMKIKINSLILYL
jgi:hypothetical protein